MGAGGSGGGRGTGRTKDLSATEVPSLPSNASPLAEGARVRGAPSALNNTQSPHTEGSRGGSWLILAVFASTFVHERAHRSSGTSLSAASGEHRPPRGVDRG